MLMSKPRPTILQLSGDHDLLGKPDRSVYSSQEKSHMQPNFTQNSRVTLDPLKPIHGSWGSLTSKNLLWEKEKPADWQKWCQEGSGSTYIRVKGWARPSGSWGSPLGSCWAVTWGWHSKVIPRPSLVVQGLRIHLTMQGTWVRSLVQEDSTYCKATKPVSHNYWACALKPVVCNKRSHCNEKPLHCN